MMLDVAYLSTPKAGEQANGDAVVVRQEEDRALFAVIDALGHGPTAASVAAVAVSCLRHVALDCTIEDILLTLHRQLRASRGAAALVCLVQGNHLQGSSVGNVTLRGSTKEGLSFVSTPGILGSAIRRLRVFEAGLHAGDRLVCFTDGVSGRFRLEETRNLRPARACQAILDGYRRADDDSTVLVASVTANDEIPLQPQEVPNP
jgi:negative regulator of sigma-B (phosphoserine phosphatase)